MAQKDNMNIKKILEQGKSSQNLVTKPEAKGKALINLIK